MIVALEGKQEGNIVSHIRCRRSAWTAENLAELLSLSKKHIYRLAKQGRMPSYRVGGAVRFDPQATADWLEDRAVA
ncbi:helix-turn-helix domain-containing protein [Granulicella rosea]|uniref:helix-turn-helix domain-containing protein n=1 Tax=Granulicella rosea TaxID=474952 RepID=UPI000B76BACC